MIFLILNTNFVKICEHAQRHLDTFVDYTKSHYYAGIENATSRVHWINLNYLYHLAIHAVKFQCLTFLISDVTYLEVYYRLIKL